jgi:threonine/homoserine/homoserine lactone efflux protein
MGFLSVVISAVAAFLFYTTGHLELMILSIILVFCNFWSWGVLRNEAQSAPNWIKWINLVFTIIGIVLLFTGLTMIYK